MLTLRLFDNDYKGSSLKLFAESGEKVNFTDLPESQKSSVRKALSDISDIPLSELAEKGAIIFPSKNAKSDLNDKNKIILSTQKLESENPVIKTTNVMGFFTVGNAVQIEIRSRFDKGSMQFFLHYMLQKVCNVAPSVELSQTSKNSLFSFAVYLFPTFLKRAMEQGLFRTYVSRAYNDSHIRGAIDFPRHFRSNIPFNGKIAYRTREFSQNNPLTHLIRHTIEYISEQKNLNGLLEPVSAEISEIRAHTENYHRQARNIIIAKNAKPLANAFYSEYENLRKLCLMILNGEKNSYTTSSKQKLNGILFDGASLWEEYLNVSLREQLRAKSPAFLLEHPNNRTKKGGKYLFKDNHYLIYPDFLLKSADEDDKYIAIFDAKYKHLEEGNISQEDYFQVLTYMFRFDCNRGVLIYPYSQCEKKSDLSLKLAGKHANGIHFHAFGFLIPSYQDDCSYNDFKKRMKKSEEEICEKILQGKLNIHN